MYTSLLITALFGPTDVLNLVLYPKDANAGARHKEKALLSLKGFSGLHVLNKMDKHFNVIVIITTDDVIPMSFETIDQRADWLAQLQGHFGKGDFINPEGQGLGARDLPWLLST